MSIKKVGLVLALVALLSFKTENQQPRTVNLKLTVAQAETVLRALSKLPFEESAGIINEITTQANKQLSDTTKKK